MGGVDAATHHATEGSSGSEFAGLDSAYPCEERSTDFLVVVGKHIRQIHFCRTDLHFAN